MSVEISSVRKNVKTLPPEVARKIAAGEVIDRPNAIVRELMDNAVDSGASSITVEITEGGIEKIRVIDDGSGMTKEDLLSCARPHATSKISSETDLLNLSTLGFRGEALASMAAVSRLEIISGGWKMNASITEDHVLTPVSLTEGTIVQTAGLFENFPARRRFLKRASSEGLLCKTIFEEKVLPRPDLAFTLSIDGVKKHSLPANQSLTQRFVQAMNFSESESLFYEIGAKDKDFSFKLVIGEPSVVRDSRKFIFIYVNGRRIQEYSLMQAIEYGCQGYFPNGTHPVASLFVEINPSLVDFNIHPAKREARFKDIAALHHSISTTTREFFKQYTVKNIINANNEEYSVTQNSLNFDDAIMSANTDSGTVETSSGIQSVTETKNFSRTQIRENTYKDVKRGDWRSKFFGGYTANPYNLPDDNENTTVVNSKLTNSSSKLPTDSTKLTYDSSVPEDTNLPNTNHSYASLALQNETNDRLEEGNFKYVGTALGTFIIAEYNETLYIIDQHAADERSRFNEIMNNIGEKQQLLIPYTVETQSEEDDNYLEEIKEQLEEAGFTAKNCGNGKWEFSTVPVRWTGSETDLSHDLLDRRINPEEIVRSVAAMTACRASVMDGTVIDSGTAERLARTALLLPDPHCPHGRPVYTSITRAQLFALVKRT